MDGVPDLARQLDYELWASTATARSLAGPGAPEAALRRFAHVAGAHLVWLGRVAGEPVATPVWPELDVVAALASLRDSVARWKALVATPGTLARRLDYLTSRGDVLSNTVGEILVHLLLHGAYHRGQIAGDLRAAGRDPAVTDLIVALRSGALDRAGPPTAPA